MTVYEQKLEFTTMNGAFSEVPQWCFELNAKNSMLTCNVHHYNILIISKKEELIDWIIDHLHKDL